MAQVDLRVELDLLNSDEPHKEAKRLLSAQVTGSLRRQSGLSATRTSFLKPDIGDENTRWRLCCESGYSIRPSEHTQFTESKLMTHLRVVKALGLF